jgi:N-acetylglucosaminyldiphosphoundecaprenol N-acetyl-beta-D-mannosaminyltransferase
MVGIETLSPMSLTPRMHREIQAPADRSGLLAAAITPARAEAAFIDGLPITLATHEEILLEIDRAIAAREIGKFISITNTESMYHGLRVAAHGEYIRKANMSLCDGVGVIVAGWAWGHRTKRFNGPVLQLECSKYGVPKGWRHFFYGGKDGVTGEMTRRLKKQYPGLIVCGTHEPPFHELSAGEKVAIIDKINNSKPDIVWVGLGLLKQERWIAEHLGRIHAPWMIGVGAAFDYHAGTVPWAPSIVRAAGLEWLFRLIIQPRLRAKRYWWSAVYVAQATFKGLVTGRFLKRPH